MSTVNPDLNSGKKRQQSTNRRCLLIVLDGVGAGELPDADKYNDTGSNTLANIARDQNGLDLPNLQRLGLGNIIDIKGVSPQKNPVACFGKCAELSAGKDTITGHWEIMGSFLEKPFPTYPNGFGPEIIELFEKAIGTKIIGNKSASGTEIINELGQKHLQTGYPIIYTSADSVFQIAAHKKIIKLERLYEICQIASDILLPDQKVARVIARPFKGEADSFSRTNERRDYTVRPPENVLDTLVEAKIEVAGIGKIDQIFAGRAITKALHGAGNNELVNLTVDCFSTIEQGLIFVNLVDFDTLWGHRNDARGFYQSLQDFDSRLPEIMALMKDDDIIFITADHGCDPTTKSTDHSREYIPLLVIGSNVKEGVNLGTRRSFADIGQTIAEFFEIDSVGTGESFLSDILSVLPAGRQGWQEAKDLS